MSAPDVGPDLESLLDVIRGLELPDAHRRHLERAVDEIRRDRARGPDDPPLASMAHELTPYEAGRTRASVERELGVTDPVKLASNEHALGASPRVLARLVELASETHRYPDVDAAELKARIAGRHGVTPEGVFVGCGSNEAIDLTLGVLRPPGAVAVFPACSFSMYRHYARRHGVPFAEVPLQGARQDLRALARRARELDAAFVLVTAPHNPTGHMPAGDEIVALLEGVGDRAIVLVDEAYGEYAEGLPGYVPAARWLPRFGNLLVTRTFSKAYGLAGLRVGYALGRPELVRWLDAARQPFNLTRYSSELALAALDDTEHFERGLRNNSRERARLGSRARELGFSAPEGGANFVFIDLGRPATPVFEALLRRGVIVRDLTSYGFPTALRVTVGRPDENDAFLEALAQVAGADASTRDPHDAP